MTYEGYGPHGVAVFVDTLTDNTTRTVADVRSVFNKFGGNLGTMGSLAFLFDHKCVFTFKKKDGIDMEELILDLIDYDVEEDYEEDEEEGTITIYGDPKSYACLLYTSILVVMFLDIDKINPSSIASVDDSGEELTYGKLCSFCTEFGNQIGHRTLIFILSQNSNASLMGYIACLLYTSNIGR